MRPSLGWNWNVVGITAVLHITSFYAMWYGVQYGFSVGSWFLFFMVFLVATLGITVGYHRLFTHGSFECAWPLKLFFLIGGSLQLQGPAIAWAANHRIHHKHVDREGDVHSPREGFWWAHMKWFLVRHEIPNLGTTCPDLLKDRLIVSQQSWWWCAGVMGFVIPLCICGWEGLLLAGALRFFIISHAIWAINSICHMWGARPYHTKDTSTNNLFLAWCIPSGEPFHNNHHADPKCAYLGWRWYDPDLGKWCIQMLSFIRLGRRRLVWNVRKPDISRMERIHNTKK